jgi:hypothetical protein
MPEMSFYTARGSLDEIQSQRRVGFNLQPQGAANVDLIRHSHTWVRGEIFEMVMITITGGLLGVAGLAFARFGATPLAKALLVPLLVLGLLFASIGISGYVSNKRRLSAFERDFRQNPIAFARAEKARVEGFQYLYTITLVLAPISFGLASGLFWLTLAPRVRAAGIALVMFGLLGLVIDAFSKERADIYYAKVVAALTESSGGATGASNPSSERVR